MKSASTLCINYVGRCAFSDGFQEALGQRGSSAYTQHFGPPWMMCPDGTTSRVKRQLNREGLTVKSKHYRGWQLEVEANGRTTVRDGVGQWFATVENAELGRKWVDTFKAVSAANQQA